MNYLLRPNGTYFGKLPFNWLVGGFTLPTPKQTVFRWLKLLLIIETNGKRNVGSTDSNEVNSLLCRSIFRTRTALWG